MYRIVSLSAEQQTNSDQARGHPDVDEFESRPPPPAVLRPNAPRADPAAVCREGGGDVQVPVRWHGGGGVWVSINAEYTFKDLNRGFINNHNGIIISV